jgi:hypothetical protein
MASYAISLHPPPESSANKNYIQPPGWAYNMPAYHPIMEVGAGPVTYQPFPYPCAMPMTVGSTNFPFGTK